jgi:hypothetical protein
VSSTGLGSQAVAVRGLVRAFKGGMRRMAR